MRGALAVSLLLHLLALLLWAAYGTLVPATPLRAPRAIRVRVTTPPPTVAPPRREKPPAPQPQPKEEPKPKPKPEPPKPKPKPEPKKPEKKPEPKPKPKPKPEPRPEPEPTRREAAADSVPAVRPEEFPGTSLAGTDADVPPRFRYYLSLLEAAVTRQWHPQRIGFRGVSRRVCVVHFQVERDGRITRETVVRSSGVPLLDREALRAVRAAGRVPPLPAGLARRALGVTFVFTLEPPGGP